MPTEPTVVDLEDSATRRRRILMLVLLLALAGGVVWMLVSQNRQAAQTIEMAEATDVRSDVTQQGDSLEIVVGWELTVVPHAGVAESVRVEVGLGDGAVAQVATLAAGERTDTLKIPAPAPGETASGYSCVAALSRGRLTRESCTPWQYVRPRADQAPADSGVTTRRARAGAQVTRIVVQPSGIQVDPDVDGRCAGWQRRNPKRSVWIEVNRRAIPECTGPNGKPTVAQFCAFAVLADGRRVKTEASTNNPYCEQLFSEWVQERVS